MSIFSFLRRQMQGGFGEQEASQLKKIQDLATYSTPADHSVAMKSHYFLQCHPNKTATSDQQMGTEEYNVVFKIQNSLISQLKYHHIVLEGRLFGLVGSLETFRSRGLQLLACGLHSSQITFILLLSSLQYFKILQLVTNNCNLEEF